MPLSKKWNTFKLDFKLFNPKSGLQHAAYASNSELFLVSSECQQYLRDLHAAIETLTGKSFYRENKRFEDLCISIKELLSDNSKKSPPATKQELSRLVDAVITDHFSFLEGTYIARIDFNMRKLIRQSLVIFLPKFLRYWIQYRVIRSQVCSLFVAKNLVCTGFSQRRIRFFIYSIRKHFGMRSIHIRTVLKEATFINYATNTDQTLAYNVKDIALSEIFNTTKKLTSFTSFGFYAFGHSLFAYENLSRLLIRSDIMQFHQIRIAPSFVANSALACLLTWRASLYPTKSELWISDEKMLSDSATDVDHAVSLDDYKMLNLLKLNDWQNYRSSYSDSLCLDSSIWEFMESTLNSHCYRHTRPYVCLYLRDGGFKNEMASVHLNSDRCVDPSTYVPIIESLIKHGYDVIRLGDPQQQAINIDSKHYFEYSHSKYKSDLNDLFITSNCQFVVAGGAGGAANIGDIFAKPTLFVDYPIVRRGLFSPLGVTIPLKYALYGEPLSTQSVLKKFPHGAHDACALRALGYDWSISNREMVNDTLRKFISCVQSECFVSAASRLWEELKIDSHGLVFPTRVCN